MPDVTSADTSGGAPRPRRPVADELLDLWARVSVPEDEQWNGLVPGPAVGDIAARLSGVPRPFLVPAVSIAALAADIFGQASPRPAAASVADFADGADVAKGSDHVAAAARIAAALGLWLFASEELVGAFKPPLARTAPTLAIDALALRLAPVAAPSNWLIDATRREEAARTFLLWNGQLPAREDAATARAALAARDSLALNRALADRLVELRHREKLTKALEDARAREAAARPTRE